jgi:hypothetical protein
MWKILLGFMVFAGLGLFMIFKGGDKVDMSGEKHDAGIHTEAPAASPANPAASAAVLVPASASAPAPLAAAASAASASK